MALRIVVAVLLAACLIGVLGGCLGRPEFNHGVMWTVMEDLNTARNDLFNFFVAKPNHPFEYPVVSRH